MAADAFPRRPKGSGTALWQNRGMNRFLPLLLLSASVARAGALSELVALSGASELPVVPAPRSAPARALVSARATPPDTIYTSRTVWNAAFPLEKKAVEKSGEDLTNKPFTNYRCSYDKGAASARCDYAYDVWPEICWYGYDHVIVDIELATGKRTEVKREWRAD